MEFKEVIKARYSCKKYSDRQVEAASLAARLEARAARRRNQDAAEKGSK